MIYEFEAGLASLDAAIRQFAAITLEWDGAAASAARAQIGALLQQMVTARTELSQARIDLIAARQQYTDQLASALLGVG